MFTFMQKEGSVMLRKENRITSAGFIVMIALALITDSKAVLFLSLLVLFGIFAYTLYKDTQIIVDIEKDSETLAQEANVRADDTHDKLVHVINAIPSPIVYINQRGDFEVSNENFDQLVAESHRNVYDVSIDSPLRQTLLDAFLNEKQFVRQFNYHEIDFQVLSIPVINEGRYNGCVLVFQDVTRIVEGEKMQKRFIADASHELRTPITSIKGMSEIMNREGFSDVETAQEFIAQIAKENHRLEQIVDDLLLQSRLKSNKVYLDKSNFNLKQFFDGLIYERRQKLHQENIKVVLNCPSDITVTADHFRLSQVVLNLFNNAINYSKDGTITIACSQSLGKLKISFKDSGEGIDPEILPHIFERFFKGNSDRSRESGGSGLGLAISKSIMEAHGGTLEVKSELGKGTEFIITLENSK